MNSCDDDSFSRTLVESSIQSVSPLLHIAAYTTEARTPLERQLCFAPSNSVQRSRLSFEKISKTSDTAQSESFKLGHVRLLGNGSKSIQKKKKSVTFDCEEHVKIIPNRLEMLEDALNWSPGGTNRIKESIFNDAIQNSKIPLHETQPAFSTNYFDNNNRASFPSFSYTPIFQTNGQPQNLFGDPNRLFSSYRSATDYPILNEFSDFSSLPRRPPVSRYNLNDYDSTLSRKNFHDPLNEFSDFSSLPRRPPRRKKFSTDYELRWPRIRRFDDYNYHEPQTLTYLPENLNYLKCLILCVVSIFLYKLLV